MSKKLWAGLGMLAMEFIPITLITLAEFDIEWAKVMGIGAVVIFNIIALALILKGAFEKNDQ